MSGGEFATRGRKGTSRRGTVLVAVIAALVVLQLTVIGTTFMGARQQDVLANTIDGTRAFYAAEAGANIAVKELIDGADNDGDGTIGGISDDGNSNNDPALGVARFRASKSVSGGTTIITVFGRSGQSQRTFQINLQ